MGKDLALDIRSTKQLNRRIDCLRYTLTSITVTIAMISIIIVGYCIWMKVDPKFYEWIEQLELPELYIGVYIIMFTSVIVLILSFVTCVFILSDNSFGLKVICGIDVLLFVFCIIGGAVLLNFSTKSSPIESQISESMLRLINQPFYSKSNEILRAIQESMGCCGANGANDYLANNHPVLGECRDSVTGSAYLYGCVEKLVYFLSEKCGWLTAVTMFVCALTVVKTVLTLILIKSLRMDELSMGHYGN